VGVSGHELFEELCEAEIIVRTDDDRRSQRDFWYFWRIWSQNGRTDNLIQTAPMERIWDAHPEVYLTNVFNLRPEKNDIRSLCVTKKEAPPNGWPAIAAGKYIAAQYLEELERLRNEISTIRPNLTICLGGTATWALLRDSRITKLRGAIASAILPFEGKVLPVFHPAGILRAYENRHVTILDFIKARQEARFPEVRRPKRKLLIPESIEDLYEIRRITSGSHIAVDIETAGEQITSISFAFSPHLGVVFPFIDPRRQGSSYWRTQAEEVLAWQVVKELAARPGRKIFQNALFDTNRLWRSYGIVLAGGVEDTMLQHHALQPESPKDLGFLGATYTNEAAWKLMRARGKDNLKKEE
jgi:uracil-DNA glycosylase family 4